MKWLFIVSAICAAVAYAALTWGPVPKAPIIPPYPANPAVVQQPSPSAPAGVQPVAEPTPPTPEPAPQAQEPPLVEMPAAYVQARQGSNQGKASLAELG